MLSVGRTLVMAVACLALVNVASARSVTCKWNPSGILKSDACLLSSQPLIPSDIHDIIDEVLATLDLGGFRCNEADRQGGVSATYEIPDDINPICYTLVYEFDLSLPEFHLNFRVLLRGAWARTQEEQEYRTCRDMCLYFKRATTIAIHMVHARPQYLGCYHEFEKNNENLDEALPYPKEFTCDKYCGGVPCDPNGGSSNPAPWIVFGILMAVLVALVALGAVFWWFKLRTP